jgi:hypothetical protein
MATWEQLIQRQSSQKIYTAEMFPARPAAGGGLEYYNLAVCTGAGIRPDLTDTFFEPRLAGVPQFTRSIQEPFFGQTMLGYGRAELKATDGGLDALISDYYWAGQQIIIKQGFDELPFSEFRTVLTGVMDSPVFYDQTIVVPVQDRQAAFFTNKLPEGDYSGTLPTVVQSCLDVAGISTKDQAAWDAWAADNSFAVWVHSNNDAVSTILDKLLSPIACWYGMDRQGRFVISTFEAPNPTDTPDLTLADDNELLEFEGKSWQKQYYKLSIKYITATGTPPTYASVSRQDSSILDLNPSAQAGERETCLTSSVDANTVRDRQWDLFSVRRRICNIAAKIEPFVADLAGQVSLEWSRFGLSGNQRIVRMDEDYTRNRVRMGLFA